MALEAAVAFGSNGLITPGFTHAPGDAGVTVVESGAYKVTFSVSGVEPNQMALFSNGVALAGATYGSGAGTQPSMGQTIVSLPAGAVLTVSNHSSAGAITLQALAGGTQQNVNASILIEKLGP